MNEQIREILKQATQYADSLGPIDGAEWCDAEYSKFAELIVKECVDILMKPEYAMKHPEELSKYNEGWVNGRLLGIEHIKEHFGVE